MKQTKKLHPIIVILLLVLMLIVLILFYDWIKLKKYSIEMEAWNGCKQAELLNVMKEDADGVLLDSRRTSRNLECGDKPENSNYLLI